MPESRRRPLAKVAIILAGVAATSAATIVNASALTETTTTPATSACPHAGRISYTLERAPDPTAEQRAAYQAITTAMEQALAVYNCHSDITKELWISYDPGVPTADGSEDGSIRFGAWPTMQRITAMHEISHTLGVGTHPNWSRQLSNGRWTGAHAAQRVRSLTGDGRAQVYADGQHFWPYGLNQPTEVTATEQLVAHVRMVVALRRDMGL